MTIYVYGLSTPLKARERRRNKNFADPTYLQLRNVAEEPRVIWSSFGIRIRGPQNLTSKRDSNKKRLTAN